MIKGSFTNLSKALTLFAVLLVAVSLFGCRAVISENEGEGTSAVVTEETATEAENSSTTAESLPEESETTPETESESTLAEPEVIPLTSITVEKSEVTLTVGEWCAQSITFTPENATDKGFLCSTTSNAVASIDSHGNIYAMGEGECVVYLTSTSDMQVKAATKVIVAAPETEKVEAPVTPEESAAPENSSGSSSVSSTDGITYVDGILIANKTYALPADYNPGVNSEAQAALSSMFADAAKEGLSLWIKSGVRTYADQKWQYNLYVERDGKALADTYSARPGHSEHQTGLAFDLNSLYKSFGNTAEGIWLAANCYKYGFIIRYPAGKEHLTGYMYEPWHVRYVGVDHATAIAESGLCLEEYLGITSEYNY